jgi:hypothetical protein
MIRLSPYVVPHFFTPLGSWYKMVHIERKGFPKNLRNWRFVTLTLDRAEYPDPEQAYEVGKRHLRQFIYLLRKKYAISRWCWKMELHRPDAEGRKWPHWHLLVDYKRPISTNDIRDLWGKGRTEIKAIRDEGFKYLFKYVSKTVSDLPDWITDRKHLRLFQTSKNFFPASGQQKNETEEASPRPSASDLGANTQNEKLRQLSIGERLERWSKLVVSRIISPEGAIRFRVHVLQTTWGDLRAHICRIKFAENISEKLLQITSHKIETSCLRILPSYLPTS